MKVVSKMFLIVIVPVLLVDLYLMKEIAASLAGTAAPVAPAVQGVSIEKAAGDVQPSRDSAAIAPFLNGQPVADQGDRQVLPGKSIREENGVPVSSYGLPAAAADVAVVEALRVEVDPAASEPVIEGVGQTRAVPALASALPAAESAVQDQSLDAFAASVVNGQPGQVVGVYVPGVMALPVIQQPKGQAGYVSENNNTITQFSAASAYGSIGLLAHNFLSGARFFKLHENLDVIILHGDGHRETYRIRKIRSYQALSPTSVYSNFINLDDPSQTVISANDLFSQVYSTPGQVVFQTCINAFGDPSWGRIFITAERVE